MKVLAHKIVQALAVRPSGLVVLAEQVEPPQELLATTTTHEDGDDHVQGVEEVEELLQRGLQRETPWIEPVESMRQQQPCSVLP
jgi:hypothetical protein